MKLSALIVTLLILLIAAGSMFTVREGEIAVLFRFGAIQRSDFQPGLHFKLPLLESVRKYDRRVLLVSTKPARFLTSEKKDVLVDYFVMWRIDDPSKFYTATGGDDEQANARLNPIVQQAIGKAFNERKLQEVVSGGRADVRNQILDAIRKPAVDLGLAIVDLRIKSTNLPDEVSDSVYQRMRAERTRVANGLRADGRQVAETINADADRQRTVIVAEAQRDAAQLRGEGEAQAAAIYARAYQTEPEFYSFWRSQQAYRQSFHAKDGVLVLDPKSEFFRYFGESQAQ
jgi:modulator of FtsH protease HflC